MKKLETLIDPELLVSSKVDLNDFVSGIQRNSVQLVDKELFFAIRGASFDGTQKIQEALVRGTSGVVVEDPDLYQNYPRTILVKDVRAQLSKAACQWYQNPTKKFHLVGITGTNGKTTTAFLLNQLWQKCGYQTGMVGTVETRILDKVIPSALTTPGPLELQNLFSQMVEQRVSDVVMEVSSIALDQKRVWGSQFAAAVFTNFSSDHLDYHGNLDHYFESKLKLFKEYDSPIIVFNADDPRGREISAQTTAKNVLSFAIHDSRADFKVKNFRTSIEGTRAQVTTPVGEVVLQTALVGKHNLYNCLAALATHFGLKGELAQALEAFPALPGAPGRLEKIKNSEKCPHVFVDYAHSEDALKNILMTLRELKGPGSKMITVFGCGGDRDKTKRAPMGKVASSFSDLTVITSDNPRTENPRQIISEIKEGLDSGADYLIEDDRKTAIQRALSLATPQDVVLVAGKGHENYQIVGTTYFPFDDRQVIREYYENAFGNPSSTGR